ncbi:GDSL-type esterase/lipase family protein [Yinghuangia seranimata]|uniref:DUF459 domain-containing protein n=1 Tax=Yinghuangia seranimata TaxID=408067 RepID=UPI00248C0B73|nr:GDSL-type esterase/lipase family protein [Yinghuangia seranimata]MDI2125541.1 GDSL-type esterase/lipase family protein [Yinghuangia seranimata]
MSTPDLRICFVGDSFTQGVGDVDRGGWAGRVAGEARRKGYDLVAYNLGVRRETSADIAARWYAEAAPRLTTGGDAHGVVFSFGVNDTTHENGRPRVGLADSVANLRTVLTDARDAGWPTLVVGPAPIPHDGGRDDIGTLTDAYAAECAAQGAPFIPVFHALDERPEWWSSITRYGDGAHCDPAGYDMLADLVTTGGWWPWLDGLTG